MGSEVHVLVTGDGGPSPEDALGRIRELEGRWSRFLPDNELNRVHAAAPSPCFVSEDTARAIDLDPTRGVALTATIARGAVATSSRLRRRWAHAHGEHHHIVDPATGHPARSGFASVTVVTGEAAWAEVLAKVVFVLGSRDWSLPDGATGAALVDDGRIVTFSGAEEVLR